jgi:hypothetical protein
MEDMNTPEYLNKIKRAVYENLRDIDAAPSVQMQSEQIFLCDFRTMLNFSLAYYRCPEDAAR